MKLLPLCQYSAEIFVIETKEDSYYFMNIVSLQSETIAVYAFLQADYSAPWNGLDVIQGVSHGFDSCLKLDLYKTRNSFF